GHVSEVINLMKANFAGESFSIWHLFRDEKRKILLEMTDRTMQIASKSFSDVYYTNYQLMSTMRVNDLPLPDSYLAAINFTMHRRLLDLLTGPVTPDLPRLHRIVTEFIHWNQDWKDTARLHNAAEQYVHNLVSRAFAYPDTWAWTLEVVTSLRTLRLTPNYYRAQTIFMEKWSGTCTDSLTQDQLHAGLGVARELELVLGFNHRESPQAEAVTVR
ncbi:MAG: hypothetical protein WA952_18205, partial [Lewinella sp.]